MDEVCGGKRSTDDARCIVGNHALNISRVNLMDSVVVCEYSVQPGYVFSARLESSRDPSKRAVTMPTFRELRCCVCYLASKQFPVYKASVDTTINLLDRRFPFPY